MGKNAEAAREAAKKLPAFSDRVWDDKTPAALEIWRVSPKRRLIDVILPEASPAEIQELCETKDQKASARGALYRWTLKAGDGTVLTTRDVRYHDMPEEEDDDDRNGKRRTADNELLAVIREQNQAALQQFQEWRRDAAQEARTRETERAAEHRRQMETLRAETEGRRMQDKAESEARTERERAWLNGMLDRDRLFFSEQRKGDGGTQGLLQTFLLGMQLEKERSDDGDEKGLLGPTLDKLTKRFMKKLGDGDEDGDGADDDEPRRRSNGKPNGKGNGKPVDREGIAKRAAAKQAAEQFRSLVLGLDEAALAKVMVSYVKDGQVTKAFLKTIARGEVDAELKEAYGKKYIAKVKGAAQTALDALRDRSDTKKGSARSEG